MRKLLKYIKEYRVQSILGPLFKLLEASFDLLIPIVVASIIDKGIAGADKRHVTGMFLVMIALGLTGLVCSITAQYFSARAATGFAGKLRSALFEKIQSLTFSELDRAGASTLLTRMTSDINQVQSGVNLLLRLFLRSPFIVFGSLVMAFTIDSSLALIFAVTIAILFAVVFAVMLVSIPLYRRNQSALDRVFLSVKENLSGVRVIRAFCRESDETESFHRKNEELCRSQMKVGRISGLINPVTFVIINAAVIVLIRAGAIKVDSGALTQGQIVALYNYMSQILIELIKLANLIITVTRAFACAERISDILNAPSQDESAGADQTTVGAEYRVSFENVGLRYGTASDNSLEGINLKVRPGETVGIIGATGSGKSSLVGLIPRFYPCTEGVVRVDGRDVKSLDTDKLRSRIGFVMQRSELFKGSVRDNMKWGAPDASDEQIEEALYRAQVLDVIKEKGGLDAEVEQEGRNFSGGQKQRLSIARALVSEPEILILDDSSSALDFATDAALRRAINSLPSSPTVFIVSQRTSSLMHADRILLLSDGRAAACGTHEELMKTCPEYRDIYYLQFPERALGAEGDAV